MVISLTEWWQALTADLVRLAPKINNSHSTPWEAAKIMASEGAKIENNLFWGLTYKRKIDAAAQQLGQPFYDETTGQQQYLPDVHTPEQLLFAVIYCQHLSRYKTIEKSNSSFVVGPVISERPLVQRNIDRLQERINEYCQYQGNILRVEDAYPDLANAPGVTLVEKIQNWFDELSVEEKLLAQFEVDAAVIIEQHNEVQHSLVTLFNRLDNRLSEKERALREISAYQQLIELLNTGLLVANNLDDEDELKVNFPNHSSLWHALNNAIPKETISTQLAVNVAKTTIGLLKIPAHMVNTSVKWALGWITPKFISDKATSIVNALSDITATVTPAPALDKKKGLLIKAAEGKINLLAEKLNSNNENLITGADFKEMTSREVTDLAEKVATIRRIVHVQRCLEQYRAVHTKGIVKFSLSAIFNGITVLMSKSFLRPLIYDTVLLTLEAKALERTLAELKSRTENNEHFDKSSVNAELRLVLGETKSNSERIHTKSIYASLFKKEGQRASKQLQDVIDTATPVAPAA